MYMWMHQVFPREPSWKYGSPIYFASRKLPQAERNYTTTEREGLDMIYALQKFIHYLLGSHFKFFTDHSTLKYLVNKLYWKE
jgi:hypothetical protein